MAQSSPQFVAPATNQKANDAGHGNRFQSKLLMLYAMRAINAGYQFYLGTELEDVGGKFDDLIFKYKDKNDTTSGRYLYAQAKHKLNENAKEEINAIQLLGTGKDNNFDLKKYFQSYVKIKSGGQDIENCIICTNVDFDYLDLLKNDIILLKVERSNWPKILDCTIYKPQQAFYKFVVNSKLHNHMGKAPLVCDFFDKLIFAVKTPNEDELDSILAKEVGKHFKLSNNVLPSAYVMNEMVNWFKKTDKSHHWLTPDKAKEVLKGKTEEFMALSHTTSNSIDYQEQLQKIVEFHGSAIDQLKKELNKFWNSPQAKVEFIQSETPKLTAVKVISAIRKLQEFPNKDDYLVISSNRLKTNKKDLGTSMKVEICHRLLIVVDEDANPQLNVDCGNLIPAKSEKKIILITNQKFDNKPYKDLISYEQLTEETQKSIEKRQVLFQEMDDKTVNELIDLSKADKALDPKLIENLLHMADDKIIEIPSFISSNFQESLYIKRQVAFPSTDEFVKKLSRKLNCSIEELMGKFRVDSNGRIEWHVQDEKEKRKLWKVIWEILKEIDSSDSSLLAAFPEERLFDPSNKKRVVIMGVAGTGKSTILSNYYKEIKKANSDWWVIKISLVDHTSALRIIDLKEDASEFFISATGIDQNPFACLLLKHRLETGDRIVIMLDGFDEINSKCQYKVVQLVEHLNESIPLYITTRPHMAEQLQFELSQLAYSLVKFTEDDQINYLTSIWKAYSTKEKVDYDETTIRSCATKLIERVAETLNDKEKEFIGIPLQCRILAVCFQSKIITIKSLDDFSRFLEGQQLDLANLYKMMFEEKRRVFREEKIKVNSDNNHIVIEWIDNKIRKTEHYLRKLAIQTIVEEQNEVNMLNPSTSFESENDRKEKEKKLNESRIRMGFLAKNDGNTIQFLHRTYAEYLVADFIYKGFLLDDNDHNKLLENEFIRKWIVEKLLLDDKCNGVRVFFDSMLKEILNDEEWKNRNQQRRLPERLQKFTSLLCDQRNEKKWALHIASKGRIPNILLFILDCLDVQLTLSEIRPVVINDISSPFELRTDVFQRILSYFNDADDEQLKKILEKLCRDQFWRSTSALELKQENVKSNVEHCLDFMESHREKVKFVLDDESFGRTFFMHHGDDDLFKKYLKLVSSVYSGDFELARFIKKIIHDYKRDWKRIGMTLTVLRDIGRINVTAELSRFVLLKNSKILQQDEHIDIRSSLEKMGRMGLYGAVLRGDLKSFEKETDCSLEKPETCSEDVRKSVLRLMLNDINIVKTLKLNQSKEFIITLFEVAAVYGREEICREIIQFLLDRGKLLNKQKMDDEIEKYENVVIVRTILKSAKAVWGQNGLIKLLKPMFHYYFTSTTSEKQIFETMFRFVVEDKENAYRDLNDIVFQNFNSIKTLEHVPCDILQGMITAAGGFEDWMKRLMKTSINDNKALYDITYDIYRSFYVLESGGFLDKLDQECQITKLIDILITLRPFQYKENNKLYTITSSYWYEHVKNKNSRADYFIEAVAKRCGEDLKKLLFIRDENYILVIFQYILRNGQDWIEKMLSNLPEKVKKEIQDLWKEETPRLIDHYFFSSPTFLANLYNEELLNAIEFYLENGNDRQLSKYGQVVDVVRLEETLEWKAKREDLLDEIEHTGRGGERCKEIVQLLETKLDSKTKMIYKKLIEEYSK